MPSLPDLTHFVVKAYMSLETTDTNVEHQVLKIIDPSGIDHIVLITTTKRLSQFQVQGELHKSAEIDVVAAYISGPIPLGQLTHGHVSRMGGTVDTVNKSARITNKSVMVAYRMQGYGVGTFMQDVIVRWVKGFDPQLPVEAIKVAEVDATPNNQLRRNKYYANFGVRFSTNPLNSGVVAGLSMPMKVSDLKSHDGWKKKITVQSIEKTMNGQDAAVCALKDQIEKLERVIQAKTRTIEACEKSHSQLWILWLVSVIALALGLWWKW